MLEEQAIALEIAQREADEAIEEQVAQISAHLAAQTLSDHVSGPSENPGGRLWGNDPPNPKDVSDLSSSKQFPLPRSASQKHRRTTSESPPFGCSQKSDEQTPSRRSRERELLSCLSEIDTQLPGIALKTRPPSALSTSSFISDMRLPPGSSYRYILEDSSHYHTEDLYRDEVATYCRTLAGCET
ncbi:hypothetical protein NLJ89_g10645 [Agrocybe chaxingu]|uniref:Uncharacterized protein n=1 Tax=Agrocybe chaxingu TaxID=84603 RepID=A0A9W8MRX9_9AGAR|nr:hypothetical protein NLJ89_g10645 [Agrocybe chaxingu]